MAPITSTRSSDAVPLPSQATARRALRASSPCALSTGSSADRGDCLPRLDAGIVARGRVVDPAEEISTVVRWNATDDDSQVWLTANDAELAMATITVHVPDGRRIFTDQLDPVGGHGHERLQYRSSEHSLGDLEKIYPPGEYRWSGRTADGRRIRGTTTISYELPDAPAIVCPCRRGEPTSRPKTSS